jgi:hypothetical protein
MSHETQISKSLHRFLLHVISSLLGECFGNICAMIEACCNIDVQAANGDTPLYAAAHNGHSAVTKQLIEARCNVNLLQECWGSARLPRS